MFGFGRRRVVEQRAKALGDRLLFLLGMINTMTYEEFIESAGRQGYVESYRDLPAKQFGFFEEPSETADISYHVNYGDASGQPTLTGETHRNYYGLILSGSSLHLGISVDSSQVIPSSEFGRDARALQASLLKFPGFRSFQLDLTRLRRP